jgi:hypothetical protein
MPRAAKPPKDDNERRQIGCKVNWSLWTEFKVMGIKQGRDAGEILEDAMREYLERHSE